MLENNFEETGAVLGVVEGTSEKCFGEALDGGEGSSEFVRDVGDKIAANAFELSQFGDVVKHYDGSGRVSCANRGDGDCEIVLPESAGHDFRLDARFAVE